jgi:hypothetical protein
MITASELRKKMTDIVMKTMDDVDTAIKRESNNGRMSASVAIREGFDYAPVLKEIESYGYQVKIKQHAGDYRDPPYRTLEISW